jgi:hypothetical protein
MALINKKILKIFSLENKISKRWDWPADLKILQGI